MNRHAPPRGRDVSGCEVCPEHCVCVLNLPFIEEEEDLQGCSHKSLTAIGNNMGTLVVVEE